MKGKKSARTLLVAILILGMATVSVGADPQPPKLFVEPQTYTATLLGEVFTIDINIANIQDLLRFELKLGYNTTLLDVLEAFSHTFYAPISSWITEVHEPEGYVWFAVNFSRAGGGDGTLAKVTFNATYAGSASCTLDLYDTGLYDFNGDPVTHDVENGNYKFAILGITVATDKSWYDLGESVEIYGNLTLDGSPCQGLVALEVDDPNQVIVIRTVQTGTTPSGNITILEVTPCDSDGNPKESFERGGTSIWDYLYVKVTVVNNAATLKNVTILVNAYDKDTVPFGVAGIMAPLISQTSPILPVPIPEWVSLGNGTVYATALTHLPKDGGVPYCPEESATFQITGGGGGAPETQGSGNNSTSGNYNLTFKLPLHDVTIGNLTVYACSSCPGQHTTSNVTFKAKLLGDVNGDGKVTGLDQILVGIALFTKPGDPLWNPAADLNGDGKVTGLDQILVGMHLFESV